MATILVFQVTIQSLIQKMMILSGELVRVNYQKSITFLLRFHYRWEEMVGEINIKSK